MAVVAGDLVGRDEELALLRDAVGEGTGSVVVAGPVGVGKSRLMEVFLDGVAADRGRVVLVRATKSTATIPFGPFASWAPEWTGDAAPGRLHVLQAIASKLLAGGERLIVGVDDAHLLDDGSAALTMHLVGEANVGVVATIRSGEPRPDAVSALWKDGLADRVDLQALSEDEARDVVEGLLDGPIELPSWRRLWALTEGVPLYVHEAVRAGLDEKVLTQEDGMWRWRGQLGGSGRLGDLVREQLGRASSRQRQVLELLAFGEPLPETVLTELGCMDAVAEAEQQGYVVADDAGGRLMIRLGHPLYGEVLRASVPRLTAREYHKQLTSAAEAVGWSRQEPLRVASWWLESGTLHGSPDMLLAAAARAVDLVDAPLAVRLAEAAEASGGGARATLARAAMLAGLGRGDEGEEVFRALAERAHDEEIAADAAHAHARYLFFMRGRPDAALEVIARSSARLQSPMRAHVLAYGGYVALFAGDPAEAARLATEAVGAAGSEVRFRVEALAVASFAWMSQGQTAAAIAAAEMAIPHVPADLGIDPNPTAVLPAAYALALVINGRIADAAGVAEALMELAHANAEFKMLPGLASTLVGRIALYQGRLDVACQRGSEGLDTLREAGLSALWPAAVVITAASQRGDTATAREALDWVARTAEPVPLQRLEVNLASAWFAAANGELSAARAAAGEVATEARAWGAWAFELAALLDVARLGAPDAASQRLDELTTVVDGALAPAAATYARALADDDADGLDDVAERFEAMGAVLPAAEAAAAAAGQHRRAGRRGSAIASLSRARGLAANTGGARTPLLQGVDAEPALATLTDREREVVELAARGMTNRDIARHLYVSIRTVNTHLSHAYDKLGLNDRTQLAALLRRQTDPPLPPAGGDGKGL